MRPHHIVKLKVVYKSIRISINCYRVFDRPPMIFALCLALTAYPLPKRRISASIISNKKCWCLQMKEAGQFGYWRGITDQEKAATGRSKVSQILENFHQDGKRQ